MANPQSDVRTAPPGTGLVRFGNGVAAPPPAPSPSLTLSYDGSATVGVAEAVTVVAANITAPASVTVARISGPSATISPVPVTPAPGELTKLAYATAAAIGTLRLQASAMIGGNLVTSNLLDMSVASAPTPSPPPPSPSPAPAAGARQFTLTSPTTQTAPFALGFALRQGDVPAGLGVVVTGAGVTAQATIKNTWLDGSAKFAVIAGSAVLTAATPLTVSVGQGTASTGTAISLADLQAAIGTVPIDAAAFGAASWSGSDWASPFLTLVSGHQMSSWVFRKAVGSDPDLVAWLEIRMFLGGAIEVLPWIESGFLTGTGPANKSAVYTFTLGGTSRFSATVDVKHHTRIPLLSGSALSYWLGTDPGVTFAHDADYLMSTGLVPHYGFGAPSSGTLDATLQVYTPNTLAGVPTAMGQAGGSGSIIHSSQARYLTSSGDERALKAAQVFGYSGGSWSIHYRDATTHQLPRFQDYPAASLQGGSPSIGAGTGGENGTPVTTHQPGFGYLPYLMTGRWWFLEEQAFWATYNHFAASVGVRRGQTAFSTAPYLFADGRYGVIDPRAGPYSNRGAHWSIARLAQTLAILPTSHPCFADYVTCWESNADFYKQVFVDGTHAPGWVSPFGLLGDYSSGGTSAYGSPGGSTSWWGAGFMHSYAPQAWGHASRLGLPVSSAAVTNATAVRNHTYKQVVERAGDGVGANFNWRRFGVYDMPIGTPGTSLPPATWYTSAQAFAEYISGWSLGALAATPGLTLKHHQSNTDMTSSDTTAQDYLPSALAGLAMAVDDGAPGANDGWLRVSGASNFASALTGLVQSPAHGITPQAVLPAFRPAPGTYRDIPFATGIGTMKSIAPVGFPNEVAGPMVNWSTAKIMPPTAAYPYGLLIVRGSGHLPTITEVLWDGNWCLHLDGVSQWFFTHIPTPLMLDNGANFPSYAESNVPGSAGYPYVGHMYWGTILQPPEWGGGPKGSVIQVMVGGWGGAPHGQAAWRFDIDTPTVAPTRIINQMNLGNTSLNYPSCIEDYARGGWWTLDYTGNSANGLVWTQFGTWAQTTYPGTSFNGSWYNCLVWIPERSCLVAVGAVGGGGSSGLEIRVCPVVGGVPQGWTLVTTSGTQPNRNRIGGDWVPDRGQIMMHEGNGSSKLHWLTPPANLTAGLWAFSEETLTGVLGATPITVLNPNSGFTLPYEAPPMTRMRWSPRHKAAIWVNALTRPAQIWTPLGT